MRNLLSRLILYETRLIRDPARQVCYHVGLTRNVRTEILRKFKPVRPWILVCLLSAAGGGAQHASAAPQWFRGNLHAHSNNSDGDSPPIVLINWYRFHGYQFLAISDHNLFTDPSTYAAYRSKDFLLIGAEEITHDSGVHVNAIGIQRAIPPQRGVSATELLQNSIDAIRAQGGVPLINHPNFGWAFNARAMLPLKRVALLDIMNTHPQVNSYGDGVISSTEQMWDELLSSGMHLFGAAVDDAHNFRDEFLLNRANPGRAWVMVRSTVLSRDAIMAGLASGEFYSSTGVVLTDISQANNSLTVEIDSDGRGNPHYRTVFIGNHGHVLAVSQKNPAIYKLRGDEVYVRARVEDSGGLRAWTQPIFISPRP